METQKSCATAWNCIVGLEFEDKEGAAGLNHAEYRMMFRIDVFVQSSTLGTRYKPFSVAGAICWSSARWSGSVT